MELLKNKRTIICCIIAFMFVLASVWATQFKKTACDPSPCLNEAVCSIVNETISMYVIDCDCNEESTGEFCELSPCEDNPCKNGGKCYVDESTYSYECDCPNSHHGLDCEIAYCDPNPCTNGGVCVVNEKRPGFTCDCPLGRYGDLCERSACDPNPCRSDGVCNLLGEDGVELNEEEEEPVSNEDGTVEENSESEVSQSYESQLDVPDRPQDQFECTCKPKFYGEICEYELCKVNPCYNGGECKVYKREQWCKCPDYAFGKYCEKNPCVDQPCQNYGECTVDKKYRKHRCKCKAGFAGQNCQQMKGFFVMNEFGRLAISTTGEATLSSINYPEDGITRLVDVGSTVFKDTLYLFGGLEDGRQISKLEGITIEKIDLKLLFTQQKSQTIQTTNDFGEVYLCFSADSRPNLSKCQVFNGEKVEELGVDTPSEHFLGALGLFLGKITALGGGILGAGDNSLVEIFESTWSSGTQMLVGQPTVGITCISLPDGSMMTLGGGNEDTASIYLLNTEASWSRLGHLQKKYTNAAVAHYDNLIYAIGESEIERFFFDEKTKTVQISEFLLPMEFPSTYSIAYSLD